ncbi:thioredoxin family protein [Ekhidna sp.]
MDLKKIVSEALNNSFSAEEYQVMLANYAVEGKTSGEQKEDLIYYTKLNAQRSKRIGKTAVLIPDLVDKIKSLPKQTWLLITETWCGDAANSVPLLAKLAELNPKIELRIVLRDENLELMDQFLTKGGRSIPKLIALDEELNVLFDWGPRPKEAQELYWSWREREDREPYKEFQVVLQKWYNDNKLEAIQEEIGEFI